MSTAPFFWNMTFGAGAYLVGCVLLFVDSLLQWQKHYPCGTQGQALLCGATNAWGGSASFSGILMSLFALLVVLGMGLLVVGATLPAMSVSGVVGGFVVGTLLFGLIRFLFAATHHPDFGAWLGLACLLVIAYGGYRRMGEGRQAPSSAGFTP